jgi:hypothetical protein
VGEKEVIVGGDKTLIETLSIPISVAPQSEVAVNLTTHVVDVEVPRDTV